MAPRIEAYVDTAAFISFLDRSDSFHPVFRRLFNYPPSLITSALVISEAHGWFLRRYDTQRAIQFVHFVDELPNLTIKAFDSSELRGATALLKKFAGQNLTLADAHGLAIMQHLSIRICWSTDRHLALTGAALVI